MELEYTYFEAEDGFFVGWSDKFPEDVTQGKSLEELEEMLADMYESLNLAKYHKRKLVLAKYTPYQSRKRLIPHS